MARWLRTLRTSYGLDQAELANYIGKSRSAVANYENGRPIPADTIALLRTSFPDGPMPPSEPTGPITPIGSAFTDALYAAIKYAGVVPCSSQWGDPLDSDETRPIDPKFAGKRRFLCKVSGDSCYPALWQGDLTVWEEDDSPPYGVIVLAERADDQACTVKVLGYDPTTRENLLIPVNPDHDSPLAEGWKVTARLVGVIRQGDGPERTWYWAAGLRPKHLIENLAA